MAKATFSTDQIQFLYCGILSFHAQNDEEQPLRSTDIEGHTFHFGSDIGTAGGDLLRVLVKVECEAQPKDSTQKALTGSITTECIFRINGLDELRKADEEEGLPEQIGLTMVSIAYSTTRGLLSAKAGGTFLEGAVLPIVQPSKLLAQED